MNSAPDKADGEVRLWIDGVLVTQVTGLRLRDAEHAGIGWDHWMFGPPQTLSKGVRPNDSKTWLDALVIATEYIGPVVE